MAGISTLGFPFPWGDFLQRTHGVGIILASNYLEGAIDDARIYDRTLTPTEIAWLAGKRDPMPKPF